MALRVVGAGLPRTGTLSLKTALERLLGARCYHMSELFGHPEHGSTWADAAEGRDVDWDAFLAGYAAAVDMPAMQFWRRLADTYPDAIILLSRRASGEEWQASMDRTIFRRIRETRERLGTEPDGAPAIPAGLPAEKARVLRLFGSMARNGFARCADDRDEAIAFHDRHAAEVRAQAPAGRLVEWTPGDGWGPLCRALDVPVPDEPFPRVNTTEQFQATFGAKSPMELLGLT